MRRLFEVVAMVSRIHLFLLLLVAVSVSATFSHGNTVELQITTAPFRISQTYKSMEGPMVIVPVTIAGLLEEGGAMDLPVAATEENLLVWIRDRASERSDEERELWWFLGAKLEALHPLTDQPVSSEFICHLNIDIDEAARATHFPESPGGSSRLLTLTGGATDFQLPENFGVPVSSDERFMIYFQALNHNLPGSHEFRHRLTLRFAKDADCARQPTPLDFHWPSIAVPLADADKTATVSLGTCTCCAPTKAGENAPANSENGVFSGPEGRTFTGHWLLPRGRSEWNFPVNYYSPGFASYDTEIRALIPHIHPYATHMDLLVHRAACGTTETLARLAVTNREQGTGLERIEVGSLAEGLPIAAGDEYELHVAYDNRSDETQDSMATLGIFTEDRRWKRPAWADAVLGGDRPTCGIPPPPAR